MRPLLILCAILLIINSFGQEKQHPGHQKTFKMAPAKPGQDSMVLKEYYFVMLVKGPDRDKTTDTAIINKLQAGHMANIKRLYDMGKILVAGPFGDNGNWRGIFVFDCENEDEVKQLLATDPMIKAGRLAYELHPWWTAMNEVFK